VGKGKTLLHLKREKITPAPCQKACKQTKDKKRADGFSWFPQKIKGQQEAKGFLYPRKEKGEKNTRVETKMS